MPGLFHSRAHACAVACLLVYERCVDLLFRTPSISFSSMATKDTFGNTALHRAAVHGDAKVIRGILEEAKISIDEPGRYGNTALMHAAQNCMTSS